MYRNMCWIRIRMLKAEQEAMMFKNHEKEENIIIINN